MYLQIKRIVPCRLFISILFFVGNCQVLRKRPHDDRGKGWERSRSLSMGFHSDRRCPLNNDLPGPIQVTTRLGTLEGTYVYLCDGPGVNEYDRPKPSSNRPPTIRYNITIFLGIPYASPPVGRLRFKPPQVQPSFGVIKALRYKSACPQLPIYTGPNTGMNEISEDCLYLNIFSPSVKRYQNEKYAVMIYLHGGEWDHGSANTFPAHMLTASQDVIVVTFNYRLGPLGFFATGENSSAGNYGLLDQAMAIEWVYDNIDVFNGDNEKITLFGPNVGAASALIHALSARLGKKIRSVIAQSGSAVADWAVISDNNTVSNNSLEYAMLFSCHFLSPQRTTDCLRSEPLSLFQTTEFKPKVGWLPWCPVIDFCTREENRRILPDLPENLIKYNYENLHSDFAYMSGVARDEAVTMILQDPELKHSNYIIAKEKFEKKIHEFSLMYNYTLDVLALTRAIKFMYMPRESDITNSTLLRNGYINMLSDSYVTAPNDRILKLLLQRDVKTYMYVLNTTLDGLKTAGHPDHNIFVDYVPHDTEYYFITGAPFMDPLLFPNDLRLEAALWTEEDRNMSEFFMTSWANFAKFGKPTPVKRFNSISWQQMKLNDMCYLSINTTNYTSIMMSNYRQKESQFWNYYIPNLMRLTKPPSTYCQPLYETWENQKHIYEASLWGVLSAVGLFLILSVLFCCLYCKAKSKHVVSSEDIPDTVSVTPSSIDTLLNMKKMESRTHYYPGNLALEQKHTQV